MEIRYGLYIFIWNYYVTIMETGNGKVPMSPKTYSLKKVVFILGFLVIILDIAAGYLYFSRMQTKNTDSDIVQQQTINKMNSEVNNADNNQESVVNSNKDTIFLNDVTIEKIKEFDYEGLESEGKASEVYSVKVAGKEIGKIEQNAPFVVIRLAETSDKLFLTTEPVGIGGNFPRGTTVYTDLYAVDLNTKVFEKVYESAKGNINNSVKAVSHNGKSVLVENFLGEGLVMQVINLSLQNKAISTFEISKEYTGLGYTAFSPDDTKIIAEARIDEVYSGGSDGEKYASFGVDLGTGKKTQFNTYDEAKKWAGVN